MFVSIRWKRDISQFRFYRDHYASLQERSPIERLNRSENESELVEKNKINLLPYTKKAGSGLRLYRDIRENVFLGWNGFMSMLSTYRNNYEVSVIIFFLLSTHRQVMSVRVQVYYFRKCLSNNFERRHNNWFYHI